MNTKIPTSLGILFIISIICLHLLFLPSRVPVPHRNEGKTSNLDQYNDKYDLSSKVPTKTHSSLVTRDSETYIVLTTTNDLPNFEKDNEISFKLFNQKFWLLEGKVASSSLDVTNNDHIITYGKKIRYSCEETKTNFTLADIKHDNSNTVNPSPLTYSAVADKINASYVHENYNITGRDVSVGVIDSGVDFGSTDLYQTRDDANIPTSFDTTGHGVFITTTALKNSTGYLQTKNTLIPWVASYENSIKQYHLLEDFKATSIQSQSGIYKVGMFSPRVPIGPTNPVNDLESLFLIVLSDPKEAGKYTTLHIDLQTSFYLTTGNKLRFEPDYSFDNDKSHTWGNGTEILAWDFNNDSVNDFSLGTLSYGLDRHKRVDQENIRVIPGISATGNFGNILTDFKGHGTMVASCIASRGQVKYNISDTLPMFDTPISLPGIAPAADIQAVKTDFDSFDMILAMLWNAGFDLIDEYWQYTGNHQVMINTNSWGASTPIIDGNLRSFDPLTLIATLLSLPKSLHPTYTGSLYISAAGNSGPYYGVLASPGTSLPGLTVGSSYDNYFISELYNITKFPTSTIRTVAQWSSAGSFEGSAKPDVLNIGSLSLTLPPLNRYSTEVFDDNVLQFSQGTSISAPYTSGVAALLLEINNTLSPQQLKACILSTAQDLGYPSQLQGHGEVNAQTAVECMLHWNDLLVHDPNTNFLFSTNASLAYITDYITDILKPTIKEINASSIFSNNYSDSYYGVSASVDFGTITKNYRHHIQLDIKNCSQLVEELILSPIKLAPIEQKSLSLTFSWNAALKLNSFSLQEHVNSQINDQVSLAEFILSNITYLDDFLILGWNDHNSDGLQTPSELTNILFPRTTSTHPVVTLSLQAKHYDDIILTTDKGNTDAEVEINLFSYQSWNDISVEKITAHQYSCKINSVDLENLNTYGLQTGFLKITTANGTYHHKLPITCMYAPVMEVKPTSTSLTLATDYVYTRTRLPYKDANSKDYTVVPVQLIPTTSSNDIKSLFIEILPKHSEFPQIRSKIGVGFFEPDGDPLHYLLAEETTRWNNIKLKGLAIDVRSYEFKVGIYRLFFYPIDKHIALDAHVIKISFSTQALEFKPNLKFTSGFNTKQQATIFSDVINGTVQPTVDPYQVVQMYTEINKSTTKVYNKTFAPNMLYVGENNVTEQAAADIWFFDIPTLIPISCWMNITFSWNSTKFDFDIVLLKQWSDEYQYVGRSSLRQFSSSENKVFSVTGYADYYMGIDLVQVNAEETNLDQLMNHPIELIIHKEIIQLKTTTFSGSSLSLETRNLNEGENLLYISFFTEYGLSERYNYKILIDYNYIRPSASIQMLLVFVALLSLIGLISYVIWLQLLHKK